MRRVHSPSGDLALTDDLVIVADNLPVLAALRRRAFDLIYMDPPFNTGRSQSRATISVARDDAGPRVGFGGRRYRSTLLESLSYDDRFGDYLAFLEPRVRAARELLAAHGTLYFHIDYREAHYCKLLLDEIFGREAFLNEIVWAYDYGAKPRRRWPAKHDDILFYARDPERYFFDVEAVDRIPYMAPGLVGPEKAARGKLPTDTWWHTIVSPTGKEKLGYPTQKPLGILRRIVGASCPPGGVVLDFFAGSGTTGAAARELGRRFLLVDSSAEAMAVMRRRFADMADVALFELAEPGELHDARGGEASLEVRAQIARVLEPDREADEAIADPQSPARLGR